MCKKIKNNIGFTVIEVIFSLAVFTILFTAFLPMEMIIIKITQQSKHQYQATVLAQKHMEELKSFEKIIVGYNTHEYQGYIIDEEVSIAEGYEGKLYRIEVKVTRDGQLLEILEGLKMIKE